MFIALIVHSQYDEILNVEMILHIYSYIKIAISGSLYREIKEGGNDVWHAVNSKTM